jgi:cysteinyl-tRNA synthetase
MTLFLYNTLSKQKEQFLPQDYQRVSFYACGPTVYDRAHLGNARAMVVFDQIFRLLRKNYGAENVIYVRNITDIDDKINRAAREKNTTILEITTQTTKAFHADMSALNCFSPTHEPRATGHIPEIQAMIEKLIHLNHAYEKAGHVLFRVTSYQNYGALSRRLQDEMLAGARIEIAPFKENPADFVLWKPSSSDEPGWESPWGLGRPGWHIECSAMSTSYLGVDFDLHAGGADLQFPHHENEIAQSCCANPGSKYARLWVHNGFLTVDGEKMSKSLGNFITVQDLLQQNLRGEEIRYALLSTHYRKPLDWTEKLLGDSKQSLSFLYQAIEGFSDLETVAADAEFSAALSDDLNTPKALVRLHEMAKDLQKTTGDERRKLAEILKSSAAEIGILYQSPADWFSAPIIIQELAQKNSQARAVKNWPEADRTRQEAKEQGYILENRPDGSTGWRKI